MLDQGAHGLIWRLARHAAVPADLEQVRRMPARVLWQAEVLADATDRIARRAHLEEVNKAAHAAALARRGRR